MTKLQIISRLWSHIYDLMNHVKGNQTKPFEEIEQELNITEYACRKYADCDDDELYTADVERAARKILEEKAGK